MSRHIMKSINLISGLLICFGFLLLIGTVGNQEYLEEIGVYTEWYYGWKQILVAFAMIISGGAGLKMMEVLGEI